ncbi:WD40 repeat-like protein [Coprinopsis marcescibilis]|uniref:WD40 repeat-like protein n=1 Tax=Coprinopsis marcescibilis TaxID=230819 RepID=A0A5C3KEH2_COPMA|nr:WD40 repeat-like protein [Coprinopsis marcescibilis]
MVQPIAAATLSALYFPSDLPQTPKRVKVPYTKDNGSRHLVPSVIQHRPRSIPMGRAVVHLTGAEPVSFMISYRSDMALPINKGLNHVLRGASWNGDLLIARVGKRLSFINMRGWSDSTLARKAVKLVELHSAPTLCLDISSDGQFVLSGGFDGIIFVWSKSLKKPIRISPKQGPITSVKWVNFNHWAGTVFFVAAGARGTLTLWRKSGRASAFSLDDQFTVMELPIESIDVHGRQIAVVGGHHLRIFSITAETPSRLVEVTDDLDGVVNGKIISEPDHILYRTVSFYDEGKGIIVGVLDAGVLIAWDLRSKRRQWRGILHHRIGAMAFNEPTKTLAVWNLQDGIHVYTIEDRPKLRLKLHVAIQRNVPVGLAFITDEILVAGSDNGEAYIWSLSDRRTTSTLRLSDPCPPFRRHSHNRLRFVRYAGAIHTAHMGFSTGRHISLILDDLDFMIRNLASVAETLQWLRGEIPTLGNRGFQAIRDLVARRNELNLKLNSPATPEEKARTRVARPGRLPSMITKTFPLVSQSAKSKRETPSVASSSRHSTPAFDNQNTGYDDSTAQEGPQLIPDAQSQKTQSQDEIGAHSRPTIRMKSHKIRSMNVIFHVFRYTGKTGEHLGSPHSFDSTEKQVKEATAGDLFVAVSGNLKAFWVMNSDNKWRHISEKEAHPTLSNHQLRISQGNPSWVTDKTGHIRAPCSPPPDAYGRSGSAPVIEAFFPFRNAHDARMEKPKRPSGQRGKPKERGWSLRPTLGWVDESYNRVQVANILLLDKDLC